MLITTFYMFVPVDNMYKIFNWYSKDKSYVALDDKSRDCEMFEACVWKLRDDIWKTKNVVIYNTHCEINNNDKWMKVFNVWPYGNKEVSFEYDNHKVEVQFFISEEDSQFHGKRMVRKIVLKSKTMDSKSLTNMIQHFEEEHRKYLNGIQPRLFTHDEHGVWKEGKTWHHNKTASNVILEERTTEKLLKSVSDFVLTAKKENQKLGLTWSYGILLHGPPGTGKTSCIKMLSKEYSMDTYLLNLSSIKTPEHLIQLFNSLPNTLHILAIDDLDYDDLTHHVLKDKPGNLINMQSTMLQCMDGLEEATGRLLIITTNHPEKLHEAFVRKRRIDLNIHLGKCTKEMIQRIYKLFFDSSIPFSVLDTLKEDMFTAVEIFDIFTVFRKDPQGAIEQLKNKCL